MALTSAIVSAKITQNVELMDRQLRERAAGRAVLVPTPGLWREFKRAFVGKICLNEGDTSEFAGVDRLPDLADARHQPCAVADRDRNPVALRQSADFEAVFERVGDRLFRIDVLAGGCDLASNGQMLLVGHRYDHAFDVGTCQQRLHVGGGRNAGRLGERLALLFAAAEAGDDFDLVRLGRGTREHLGPASEPDDPHFYPISHPYLPHIIPA